MKIIAILFILFFIPQIAFADKIQIPFSCYPKELQKSFSEHGLKLDLSGNDRTPDSWGFLENKGSEFWIYTYKPVTIEELNLIKELVWQRPQ